MNFNFAALIANPIVKTVVTNAVGAAAYSVVNAIDHPTGGLATTLSTNPTAALAYLAIQQLAHNAISHLFPPTTVVTK